MAFWIHLTLLRGLPPLLSRLAADAETSSAHLRDRVAAGGPAAAPGSLLAAVREPHRRIVGLLADHLAAVRATAAAAAASVSAAIDGYEHAGAATGAPLIDGPGYDDQARPAERLAFAGPGPAGSRAAQPGPAEARADEGEFDFDLWPDLLSPAGTCRREIWDTTVRAAEAGLLDRPVDILDDLVRPVSGDWPALHGWADTYRALGAAYADMGRNLAAADQATLRAWGGEPATACREFLVRFDAALAGAASRLDDLAKRYDKAGHDGLARSQRLAQLIAEAAEHAASAPARPSRTDVAPVQRLMAQGGDLLTEVEQAVEYLTAALAEASLPIDELPPVPVLTG